MRQRQRHAAGYTRAGRRSPALIALALIGAAACSTSSSTPSANSTTTTGSGATTTAQPTPTTEARPAGPVADMSTELVGGHGVYMGEAAPPDLQSTGYTQREYAAAGTATSYRAVGALSHDGRWRFAADTTAAYRTRVLVRMPAKRSAFSGTVIVEWLNVSAGIDADPDWVNIQEETQRAGDAWVGVSAQRIGVEGGPVAVKVTGVPGADAAGKGLVKIDPARYGSLRHPGDAYSFDIFTQIARAVRQDAGLGGARPARLIAAGQSQSAFAMVTYYNGVQPLTHAFDGFFVHSRGGSSLPLVNGAQGADIAAALTRSTPTIMRTDQAALVLDIQTETDITSILNSYAARQPDNAHFHLWEVAGTAHADAHQMGANASAMHCGVPINNGPMHIVADAALRALTTWLTTGRPPPTAPRIDVIPGAAPTIRRDADGIALGGIRTPPVVVPVAALSGASGPHPSTICLLLGSTRPFTAARIKQLYPSRADYVQRYAAATDATIKAGFALAEDRDALIGFSTPSLVP